MRRTSAFLFSCIVLFAGCGKVDETVTQDNNPIDDPSPPAYNCKGDTPSNNYGCYGNDVTFHDETIADGIWSVYTQSNTNRLDGRVFYDRYQYGFDFSGDGGAFKQQQTDGYTYFREWGVNDAGTAVAVSDEGTYTWTSSFSEKCFEVSHNMATTNDIETVKFCHEDFVDQSNENTMGYYGANVKFGNLENYNFTAVGTWTISGYGDNGASLSTVSLADNGTIASGTGGEWGVSRDGKVIGIDGVRYLVYQYLSTSDDHQRGCIAVFELSGGEATSTTWKLCRQ